MVEKAATILGARVVTFGTVMCEEARKLGWAGDRDGMRRLPVGRQRRLQRMAAAKIAKSRDRVLFVDTHLFIRTPEGIWPGLPFDVVRGMRPTHLVLVEATPEEIFERRAADRTRSRDAVTVRGLRDELDLGRSFLTASATLTGAPMLVLANGAGKAEQAAHSLVGALAGPLSVQASS